MRTATAIYTERVMVPGHPEALLALGRFLFVAGLRQKTFERFEKTSTGPMALMLTLQRPRGATVFDFHRVGQKGLLGGRLSYR
jgi:hypothetical protein